jgi:hypothetical protein
MPSISQWNALRTGVKADAEKPVNILFQLAQKRQLLDGRARTYELLEEGDIPEGVQRELQPAEIQLPQYLLEVELRRILGPVAKYLDTEVTLDASNAQATADLTIEGNTIATGLHPNSLLWLEKRLAELHTLVSKMPTHDPAYHWHWDASRGCYASDQVQTRHTKKVNRVIVAIKPTEHQPGQFALVPEDARVGTWSTEQLTGTLPRDTQRAILDRIRAAEAAAKTAREQANREPVVKVDLGNALLKYLFAPLTSVQDVK